MVVEQEIPLRADNDNAWKVILNALLRDFMEFFWYEAYQDIDWEKPYELLEQELLAIIDTKDNGKRCVDKLFRVYLKNGQEQWILLHIEIQHSKDEDFSERMFVYFYRIYDQYKRDIASIAVLADRDINWRPNSYHRKIWDSEITRNYKVIKIMDYKSKETELKNSNNPFAMVILLQLAALETRPDDKKRLMTKLEFFRSLYKQGWDRKKVYFVYRFLDIILALIPKFELEYNNKSRNIDRKSNMSMVLAFERAEARFLIIQLKYKFPEISEDYVNKIYDADSYTLEKWGINLIQANSLDEVFKN